MSFSEQSPIDIESGEAFVRDQDEDGGWGVPVEFDADAEYDMEQLQDQIEHLNQQLQIRDVMLDLERIWARIFGSQVAFLRHLAALATGVSADDAQRFVEQRVPALNRPWHVWMLFLLDNLLVEFDQSIDKYRITEKGRIFLGYIDAGGYPDRPF